MILVKTLPDTQIKVNPKTLLFFFMIILATCRGGLELLMTKKFAMALQFAGITALSALIFFPKSRAASPSQKFYIIFALIFIAESFLSCFLTFTLNETKIWVIYFAFNLGLLWIGLFTIRRFEEKELKIAIAPILLFAGWLLLMTACLEQVHLIKFDATGEIYLVRPASLTGSFLHYPIIMILLGMISLQWYALSKKKLYLWSGLIFCLAPLAAASRSGALILLASILFYPLVAPFRKSKKIIILITLIIACGFLSFLYFSKESRNSPLHNMVHHMVMAASKKSIGNNIRINIWNRVISEWVGTNLLIGEEAGKYTNASNNMLAKKKLDTNKSRVTESSVLQLLMNFGLIGMVLFYAILLQIPRFIHPGHCLLKAAFYASLIQTLFYQSIEVVPFMTLLFLFPVISQVFNYSQLEFSPQRSRELTETI